jgi:hypothetical protein
LHLSHASSRTYDAHTGNPVAGFLSLISFDKWLKESKGVLIPAKTVPSTPINGTITSRNTLIGRNANSSHPIKPALTPRKLFFLKLAQRKRKERERESVSL